MVGGRSTSFRILFGGCLFAVTACGARGNDAPPPASAQARTSVLRTVAAETSSAQMSTFEQSGYELSGAEYWPYVGTSEPRYPEDVLWGFYPKKGVVPPGETDPNPDTASRAAVACAERAYAELKAFLAARPSELDAVVEAGKDQGVTRRFYLWTNDYTKAADPYPAGERSARLWYWKRKTPDPTRPAGYWKWESVLTQKGECKTPSVEEARAYLRDKLDELRKASPAASPAP